jgi:hypothetical protein
MGLILDGIALMNEAFLYIKGVCLLGLLLKETSGLESWR